jgi:excisionase family DNA binding protein
MESLTLETLPKAVANLTETVNEIKRLLIEKSSEQPEADQLLTIQQAAELLSLSVPTIYGYVHRAEIPVSKRAGTKRLIFSKQELIAWVKAGRKKTVSEISAESHTYLRKKKGQNDEK